MHAKTLHARRSDTPASIGAVSITDDEFSEIRKIVYDNFGIHLKEQKRSLVVGRLRNVMHDKGFPSFGEYFRHIQLDSSGRELGELANLISTNHTFFFREKEHFDFFKGTALPEAEARLKEKRSKDLRIWCAGCSYGDEPYSLMISTMEYFNRDYTLWNAGLLATDISSAALAVAKAGVYPEDRLRLVPPDLKIKYFDSLPDGSWKVSELLKKEITFRRLNLINKRFPLKNCFDIISCRNVMIYFDKTTRIELVQRFYDLTVPGGYLFIGHSETIKGEHCPYDYVKPAIYRKKG